MDESPPQVPPHLAWATALTICERLDGAERNELKAYAASLIARHVIGKIRRRSLAGSGGAGSTGPSDGNVARDRG